MTTPASTSAAIYRDATRPISERVQDLLERMTLDEKIAQLGSAWVYELLDNNAFAPEKAQALMAHGIGQITRIGGASSVRPADSARLANTIQRFLVEQTRLGIPAIVHEETCSGYMARSATCFPQIIGLASTWEPELAEAMGAVIRTQMQAVGAHQALAPMLDVTREPRWGRVEETFGDDTYLVSCAGSAFVRGLQTNDLGRGVLATGKHFLAYGASEGGMNWAPVHLGRRELLEVYATPFEAAIREAGLASMMNSYSEIDGVPLGASRELLNDLLRGPLGFDGVLVSDYFTVTTLMNYHGIAADEGEAARRALEAGMDVELPASRCYGEPLRQAIEAGKVDVALVDTVGGGHRCSVGVRRGVIPEKLGSIVYTAVAVPVP